jgi:hypothetical protein
MQSNSQARYSLACGRVLLPAFGTAPLRCRTCLGRCHGWRPLLLLVLIHEPQHRRIHLVACPLLRFANMPRVGQISNTYVRIDGVCMTLLAGKLLYIRLCTVCIHYSQT